MRLGPVVLLLRHYIREAGPRALDLRAENHVGGDGLLDTPTGVRNKRAIRLIHVYPDVRVGSGSIAREANISADVGPPRCTEAITPERDERYSAARARLSWEI